MGISGRPRWLFGAFPLLSRRFDPRRPRVASAAFRQAGSTGEGEPRRSGADGGAGHSAGQLDRQLLPRRPRRGRLARCGFLGHRRCSDSRDPGGRGHAALHCDVAHRGALLRPHRSPLRGGTRAGASRAFRPAGLPANRKPTIGSVDVQRWNGPFRRSPVASPAHMTSASIANAPWGMLQLFAGRIIPEFVL